MNKYEAKKFENLIGVEGISEQTFKNHFALYEGYVNNVNKFLARLETIRNEGNLDSVEYAETQRRFGWEFDGMRLHEYYFGQMSKKPKAVDEKSPLTEKINESFGSFEMWEKDFKATASMRGIGWAILYYDPKNGNLINLWINEHNQGHPAGCIPLLLIDVFEHAYFIDYGTKRAGYIDAFMKLIDWEVVEERFSEI